MGRLLLGRLASSALLVLLVLTATFALLHLVPGDPTAQMVDPRVPPEQRAAIRALWGLDQPVTVQYGRWLGRLLRHGDWGTSLLYRRPAAAVVGAALPTTLWLGFGALLVQLAIGVPAGVWAARRAGRAGDRVLRLLSLGIYSLPTFWLALMALLLFAYRWPLFPPSHLSSPGAAGWPLGARLADQAAHLALPCLVLGLASAGFWVRLVRGAVLETLSSPAVLAARARGLTPRRVLWQHGLRPALGPLVQLVGLSLPVLLSGALVVEVVFSLPGLGRVAYEALLARDGPLVLACTAWSALLVVAGTLAADLLHLAVDPRVRDERGAG